MRPRRGGGAMASAALDLLPAALLATAAVVRPLRLPMPVVLVSGFVLARRRDARRAPAWAATVPVAVSLAWGLLPPPAGATDGSTCSSPRAPFATWRAVEAVLALGTLAVLLPLVGGGVGELGLRRPTQRGGAAAAAVVVVCGPAGLVAGPVLAEPFFGPLPIRVGEPGAIVPALVFALSNGVMEEIAYRGSLQAWTARVTGPGPAIAGQALVFGLAHVGLDVTGPTLPLVAVMTAGGLLAGLIAWRTGSLLLPIAAHIGLDIPLYYGNACRLP